MPVIDVEDEDTDRTIRMLMRAIRAIDQTATSAVGGTISNEIALDHIRMYVRTALSAYAEASEQVDSL